MAYAPFSTLRQFGWRPSMPAFAPALIATLGCALPLLLGLFSGHSGFIWAATGAFVASLSNPLQRLGMLHMCLLVGLGAISAGAGFWADNHPIASASLFAVYGLLFAWLQRHGNETGKLGFCLVACLCLGQGQQGVGALHSGLAVGVLFAIGGCWAMFLGFGLRGVHGLRMWPELPRLKTMLRIRRLHNKRLPHYRWVLFATITVLSATLAGFIVSVMDLPRGYWLTLATFATLQLDPRFSARNTMRLAILSLVVMLLICVLGHSLQSPQQMVMVILGLIYVMRAFLARRYAAYTLQALICFILLAESLSRDWYFAMQRLENGVYGAFVALVMVVIADRLSGSVGKRRKPAQTAPDTDSATTDTDHQPAAGEFTAPPSSGNQLTVSPPKTQ
jgi:hypothetical protein